MESSTYEDYCWLVGPAGQAWLERLQHHGPAVISQVDVLRRTLSPGKTHLLIEQSELRRRAATKFPAADRMFFMRQALEQATDHWIARFKAKRFPADQPVVDLCCGIGGDLLAIGRTTRVTAVDRDPVAALLAETNGRALGVPIERIQLEDASRVEVAAFAAWHIDPDRRHHGHRTAQPAFSEPSLETVDAMIGACPDAAIKLAPAARLPDTWSAVAERQWIGRRRECKQQVAWFGGLARHAGRHSAVVLDQQGEPGCTLVGTPEIRTEPAGQIGRFVYEPHAAVLAARLTGALARRHQLRGVAVDVAYLTADERIDDSLLSGFEVIDVLPMDVRRLRSALRHYQVGRLEIKKRSAPIDPRQLAQRLKCSGPEAATLLVTPWDGAIHAILARRMRG